MKWREGGLHGGTATTYTFCLASAVALQLSVSECPKSSPVEEDSVILKP